MAEAWKESLKRIKRGEDRERELRRANELIREAQRIEETLQRDAEFRKFVTECLVGILREAFGDDAKGKRRRPMRSL